MLRRWGPFVLIVLFVIALDMMGAIKPLDDGLRNLRFRLAQSNATGQVVLVEIDSKSLREVGSWPWPRRLHGDLLSALSAAGAKDVAFDIDFSSTSNPTDDAAFEQALKTTKLSVFLPEFHQHLSSGSKQQKVVVNKPLKRFASHAWSGSVNIIPDSDGILRHFHSGRSADGKSDITLMDILSGKSIKTHESFLIDFGIKAETIPRLSYIDVLKGRVDKTKLKGKKIIVGGTAVELADRYSVPISGIISGPLLQALALETILQDRKLHQPNKWVPLAGLIVLLILLVNLWGSSGWRTNTLRVLALTFSVEATAILFHARWGVSLDTGCWHAKLFIFLLFSLLREIDLQSLFALIAKNESRNRKQILNQVFDDSFDGIVVIDQEHKIVSINQKALKLLGYDAACLTYEMRAQNLLPEDIFKTVVQALQDEDQKNTPQNMIEFSYKAPNKDQIEIEFIVTASTVLEPAKATKNSKTSFEAMRIATCTFRDITRRMKAQAAINLAAEKAISANKAKTEFLANMSHELRTPLHSIIGFSEVIKDQSFGPLGSDNYVDYANEIYQNGSSLLGLLNSIMEMSKLEAGALQLNEIEFDINSLFSKQHDLVKQMPQASGRKIKFVLSENLPLIRADNGILNQALEHVISNAVKFTSEDGEIRVSAQNCSNGGVVFIVADNGVGVAAENIPELTKMFYQVDGAHDRAHAGTGLGLALVDGYVRAHGGQLEIKSKLGEGTSVLIYWSPERCRHVTVETPIEKAAQADEDNFDQPRQLHRNYT